MVCRLRYHTVLVQVGDEDREIPVLHHKSQSCTCCEELKEEFCKRVWAHLQELHGHPIWSRGFPRFAFRMAVQKMPSISRGSVYFLKGTRLAGGDLSAKNCVNFRGASSSPLLHASSVAALAFCMRAATSASERAPAYRRRLFTATYLRGCVFALASHLISRSRRRFYI